jgi:hypothetical protein
MDMEEHEQIRRSVASFYAMFGANPVIAGCSNEQREYLSRPITSDEKEQKDCSSVSIEDRKDEAEALGREGWASSDVRHLLVRLQHNALPLCDGSDGQGCSKAVGQSASLQ